MSMLKNDVMTEINKRESLRCCEGCGGGGIYLSHEDPYVLIQRCSHCGIFESEFAAATAFANEINEMILKLVYLSQKNDYPKGETIVYSIHEMLKNAIENLPKEVRDE